MVHEILTGDFQWFYASRNSSAIVKKDKDAVGNNTNIYKTVKLESLVVMQEVIARSQAGAIVRGLFMDKQVVFKTIDITKVNGGISQFEKEVAVYKRLKDLQGEDVPKFFGCGTLKNLLYVLVLEDVGQQISRAEYFAREDEVKGCIDRIHNCQVEHADLKLSNIMVDHKNKVRIIDFGFSNIKRKRDRIVESVDTVI